MAKLPYGAMSDFEGPLGPMYYRRKVGGVWYVFPRARRDAKTQPQLYQRALFSLFQSVGSKMYLHTLKPFYTHRQRRKTALNMFTAACMSVPDQWLAYPVYVLPSGSMPPAPNWELDDPDRIGTWCVSWRFTSANGWTADDALRIIVVRTSPLRVVCSPIALTLAAGYWPLPIHPYSDRSSNVLMVLFMMARQAPSGLWSTSEPLSKRILVQELL